MFLTNKCSTFTFVIKNKLLPTIKTYIIMENVNKLAILLNVIQNKSCVFVPMNLVRDFSDLCKKEGIKTEAEIYIDKMLFTLIK